MYEKDGMVFQSPEEYLHEQPALLAKQKKRQKSCLIALLTGIVAFILLIVFVMPRLYVRANWTSFTPERIQTLESLYNLDLSEAEPVRYYIPRAAPDTLDCFNFRVTDYAAFMETCFFGEIISSEESADKSYATYTCKPYPDLEQNLNIQFERDGEQYKARLIRYCIVY